MLRVLLISCMVFSSAALADGISYTTTEQAFETSADLLVLPDHVPSSVAARGCPQCSVVVLQLTNATKFLKGRELASLDELRQLARNNRNIGIFYDPKTKNVDRVVIYGVPKSPAKTRSTEKNS